MSACHSRRNPRSVIWLVLGASLAFALVACTSDTSSAPAKEPASASATAPASVPQATKPATSAPSPMAFDTTTMTIKGHEFSVEVAQSDAQSERGLMYRNSMPADHGMLFVMPREDTWSFWMHETRIPLDIIFLDKHGIVIDIQKRAPMDERGMGPALPALYVIELNQGTADKIGLKRGDTVEIPRKYVKS